MKNANSPPLAGTGRLNTAAKPIAAISVSDGLGRLYASRVLPLHHWRFLRPHESPFGFSAHAANAKGTAAKPHRFERGRRMPAKL